MSSLMHRFVPQMMRDIERSFERAFDDPFFRTTLPALTAGATTPLARWNTPSALGSLFHRPLVDLSEKKDTYIIEADLPGVNKEDISLEFHDNNTLTLKGTISSSSITNNNNDTNISESTVNASESKEEQQGQVDTTSVSKPSSTPHTIWNQERFVGSFMREFTFPSTLDPSKVNATLKNGVLTITVPKNQQVINAQKIEITSE